MSFDLEVERIIEFCENMHNIRGVEYHLINYPEMGFSVLSMSITRGNMKFSKSNLRIDLIADVLTPLEEMRLAIFDAIKIMEPTIEY